MPAEYRLKHEIDSQLQSSLTENGILFPIDRHNRIPIHEANMDWDAKAGMLYVMPEEKLPPGELPFLVAPAQWLYGVFHFKGMLAIIEVSSNAVERVGDR